ncbi:MAG: O-antigen ligase family protein [Clostridiaceae bacterium]
MNMYLALKELKTMNELKTVRKKCLTLKDSFHFLLLFIFTGLYIIGKLQGRVSLSSLAFLGLSLICIISDINQLTYTLFFMAPMYLFIVVGSFPLFNIIILMLLVKRLVFNKVIIPIFPVMVLLTLTILDYIYLLFYNQIPSLNFIKVILIIFLTILHLFETPEGFESSTAIKYLTLGAFIYSLCFILININTVIGDSNRTGGMGELDANTYGLYNIFTAAVIASRLISKKLKGVRAILYSLFLIIIFIAGIMTLSKTYIITAAIALFFFVMTALGSIKKMLIGASFMVIAFLVLSKINYLVIIFNNLLLRFTSAASLEQLTTGRSVIYGEYLNYLKDNVRSLFLGEGLSSYLVHFTIRPHNSIIELVISWGLFGTIAFGLMFFVGAREYKRKGCKGRIVFVNTIPFIVLFIFIQTVTVFYQEGTYPYLLMAIIMLYEGADKKEVSWKDKEEVTDKTIKRWLLRN